ncbi:MAG: hypothetical protein ACK53Y_08560, partial [bacterium]
TMHVQDPPAATTQPSTLPSNTALQSGHQVPNMPDSSSDPQLVHPPLTESGHQLSTSPETISDPQLVSSPLMESQSAPAQTNTSSFIGMSNSASAANQSQVPG